MDRLILIKIILCKLTSLSINFRNNLTFNKQDKTPVTELDIVNQFICETIIQNYFPFDKIISEEDMNSEFSKKTIIKYEKKIEEVIQIIKSEFFLKKKKDCDTTHTWFIDPIDGTKGFIDNMTYSIAIAIICNNKITFGGISSIGLNKIFDFLPTAVIMIANDNKVEVLNEKQINITIPQVHNNIQSVAISRKHKSKELYVFLNNNNYTLIEIDSQAKYLVVALGLVDIYIREQGSCGNDSDYSWDHLAGIHLVKVNEGVSKDIENKEVSFDEEEDKIYFNKLLITARNEDIFNTTMNLIKKGYVK
jgi:3'-phosphoadenosine 5'-phosphosulfate (PAPS) 3'-phosphatase